MESLGGKASATGIVEHYGAHYPGLVDAFVIDRADVTEAEALRATGVEVTVLDTVMRSHADRQQLAEDILAAHLPA